MLRRAEEALLTRFDTGFVLLLSVGPVTGKQTFGSCAFRSLVVHHRSLAATLLNSSQHTGNGSGKRAPVSCSPGARWKPVGQAITAALSMNDLSTRRRTFAAKKITLGLLPVFLRLEILNS